jgi:hypothetical protein
MHHIEDYLCNVINGSDSRGKLQANGMLGLLGLPRSAGPPHTHHGFQSP